MGCGCGGSSAAASASSAAAETKYTIKFTDGSSSSVKYANEAEARVALARSGKSGIIRPA